MAAADSSSRPPRRPAFFSPAALEEHGGTYDPTAALHAAHETAAVLLHAGRAATDAATTDRLVALVDEIGLDAVADLWSQRPARSLPGALWRLYALREWVVRRPLDASREYAAGIRFAGPEHVVAGAADPAGPDEVAALADQILRGAFNGDFGVALERAAAFCRLVAAGRADSTAADPSGGPRRSIAPGADARTGGHGPERDDELEVSGAREEDGGIESAALMLEMGADLAACASLWRTGALY